MSVMLNKFLISFIIICSSHFVLSMEKGLYTIVAPGTIKPESLFHLSLSLNDYHSPCCFNISFINFFNNKNLYEYESIYIEPKTTKLVELRAPSVDSILVNLEVLGYCGELTKDTALIYFENEPFWTFIQINKFKYKPGEWVQFRIICIDQLTIPAKLNQNIIINIYDGKHNLVKTFFDVKLEKGVFKSKFLISKHAVLGQWKIRVTSKEIFQQKTFEIEKYEVPKFNVYIRTKKIVSIYDDQIELEVSASYFSGEPVKGNLSINLSNTDLPWHKWVPPPPSISRESKINGKSTIFINLRNDLQLEKENEDISEPLAPFSPPITPYEFHIEAYVIDALSGEESWTTTEIEVNSQPFKINFEAPSEFDSDENVFNIKVKVSVKDFQNNEIQDIKTTIEIIVGCYEKIDKYIRSYADFDEVRIEYRKEMGKDFSIISVKNKNYTECYLYAKYQRIKSSTLRMYKQVKTFAMEVLTENPKEGKELEVKITNPEPLEEFSYEVFARGDIIQSERVIVPGNQTFYVLRLNVTFLMVPRITIYAHHIKNGHFSGQLKDVVIKRASQNSIKIESVNETKPDSLVSIKVTTDKGSYVCLMALDQRGLDNIDETYIFNEENVNMKLGNVNSVRSYNIPFYGRTEDVITFSNVFPTGRENGRSGGDFPRVFYTKPIKKRYPESWLFNDFEGSPEGGFTTLENTPDTITTWEITGFSLHPETGLAFTQISTNLKVFQNSFISMDLPISLDKVGILKVNNVTNYLTNQDNLTNMSVECNNEDFDFMEENIQKNDIRIADPKNPAPESQKMHI
ncbi:CD109 antigen-like isoform X2 [Eupeodes corollae]|uniref:CD109 antigen-like isoform X2 n=1 Tax=Eupeodes corollae TaxID=290404 RepID=UPI0024939E74|nr:CD109 antigen-like isoform X2 [Eupeodes corollae]